MNASVKQLLQQYRRLGILIDTNILVLYFVGSFNQELIPTFKRTRTFTKEDYSLVVDIFNYFEVKVATPNILTEVSNLLGQLAEYLKPECFARFAKGISLLDEHYILSVDIAQVEGFKRFGLTDIGILNLARSTYLVLTDDFKLSQYLQKQGVDVLNFNHIRSFG